jgi:diguanylate cyclase (GGDEF)-like protein
MSDSPTFCTDGKPCPLEPKLDALKARVSQLSDLVSTDTLTGLSNYRHFTNVINQEVERSKRTGQPTTLIMIDADHFKKVNDNWGHEVGNQALKLIANCILENIRQLDTACRYGGEEFVVILPSTDTATSLRVAERIRTAIENKPLTIEVEVTPITHTLTVSIGVSSYLGKLDNDDWHKLVERADNKLYEAKQNGRNQVCSSQIESDYQQVSEDEKSALFDMFNK